MTSTAHIIRVQNLSDCASIKSTKISLRHLRDNYFSLLPVTKLMGAPGIFHTHSAKFPQMSTRLAPAQKWTCASVYAQNLGLI